MFQESGPGRFRTANSSDSREVRRGSKAKEPGVDQETCGPFSLWVSQLVVICDALCISLVKSFDRGRWLVVPPCSTWLNPVG